MMKVGKDRVPTTRAFTYKDVLYDDDGWADATKFLPGDFDLVNIKLEDNTFLSAWYTGVGWDGLVIKRDNKVKAWKRKPEENQK